jgi:hypothetical protein
VQGADSNWQGIQFDQHESLHAKTTSPPIEALVVLQMHS